MTLASLKLLNAAPHRSAHLVSNMQTSSRHPDNEAAMLLLGLFDQGLPDGSVDTGPQGSDAPNKHIVVSASKGSPVADCTIVEGDGTHPVDLDIDERDMGGGSLAPTLKRKRTSSLPEGEALLPASISSSRTRPDLPHFMGFDNQLYRCVCGTTIEPDAGTSIQCESCLAWQHAGCFGLRESELEGHSYFCQLCSDEDEFHQPDGSYVEYIQRLALNKDVASLEPSLVPDVVQREGKRPRLPSSTGRGGKSRVRVGGLATKPTETEGSDRKAMSPSSEVLPAVAPRNQRKKSIIAPRISKGKATLQVSVAPEDAPQDAPLSDARPHRSLDDADCPLRLLEYIPILSNLVTSHEVEDTLHRLCLDQLSDNGAKRTVAMRKPRPGPSDYYRVATSTGPLSEPADRKKNPNVFVKLIKKNDATEISVPELAGHASPDPSLRRPFYNPDNYGVYARREIGAGAFLGEYCGEIYSASEYENDPANQYALFGSPKAFVRRIGPPFGIVIDARRYGTDMRFTRSSCHPNACLSSMTHESQARPGEVIDPTSFGVFATRNIQVGEEVTLPWQWDHNHIIHQLQEQIRPSSFHSQRLDAIGDHLAKFLTDCACTSVQACVVAKLLGTSLHQEYASFACGSIRAAAVGTSVNSWSKLRTGSYDGYEACLRASLTSRPSVWQDRFSPADNDLVLASTSNYHLGIWLGSQHYACDTEDDNSSVELSMESSNDSDFPDSLADGWMSSPLITNPDLAEAQDKAYSEVRARTPSVFEHNAFEEEEDRRSVSATSTLTEPLTDNTDGHDQSDLLDVSRVNHMNALPPTPNCPVTADRSSPETGPLEGTLDRTACLPQMTSSTTRNGFQPDEMDCPADRFPLEKSKDIAGMQSPTIIESASASTSMPLHHVSEPEDIDLRDTTQQDTTKDQSRTNKKRINLTHFMQSTVARTLPAARPSSPLALPKSPETANRSASAPEPGMLTSQLHIQGSTAAQCNQNDSAPWWKSSIASPRTVGLSTSPREDLTRRYDTDPSERPIYTGDHMVSLEPVRGVFLLETRGLTFP